MGTDMRAYCKHCGTESDVVRLKTVGCLCWRCIREHREEHLTDKDVERIKDGKYEEVENGN